MYHVSRHDREAILGRDDVCTHTQEILVPAGTPIGTTMPADPSFLKPGAYVFVATQVDAEGKMTALRIQVSKDGFKPPQ
jgi:hypothetical protein